MAKSTSHNLTPQIPSHTPERRSPYRDLLFYTGFLGVVLFSVWLRLYFAPVRSLDFEGFLEPWYQFILENDRFWALHDGFYNYNPTYIYLLVIVSYIFPDWGALPAVKLVSNSFDYLNAFLVFKIIQQKYTQPGSKVPFWGAAAVLLAPSLLINSSFWGQADGIYTCLLLASLLAILVGRSAWACLAFGIAFSIKQQALFCLPVLLIALFKRLIRWRDLLWIPGVYFVLLIPAWIAGRPIQDLVLIYVKQAGTYQDLTKGAPSLYQWVSNDFYDVAVPVGLTIAFTVMCLFVLYAVKLTRKITVNSVQQELLIRIALLSSLLMPYILPKMHERYFYTADLISIIYAFYFPRSWPIPILIIYSSLFTYMPFLLDRRMVSHYLLSLVLGGVLIVVSRDFYRHAVRATGKPIPAPDPLES